MKVGFIGGGNCHALTFARHFAAAGVDCFGIGRNAAKPAPLWLAPSGYRYYRAHLGHELTKALQVLDKERPEVIVCIAAQGESAASFGMDAWAYYQTNCVYLVKLVEMLRRRSWLRLFVQVSTSEIYGSVAAPAKEDSPARATSPYAISKGAFDAHLQVMHRVHSFPAITVRPSNAYCEGQQLHRILPRATIAAIYGGTLTLHGGGAARKSYMHTEDLARALEVIIERGTVGETYNVGPEHPVEIRSLVAAVASITGAPWDQFVDESAPAREGEDSTYWLDSSRARALGWKPSIDLEAGVLRMVRWVEAWPDLASMPSNFRLEL